MAEIAVKKKLTPAASPKEIKELAFTRGVSVFLEEGGGHLEDIDSIFSFDKNSKALYINVPKLEEEDKNTLLEIIRYLHENGELLLKTAKKETLKDYDHYRNDPSYYHDKSLLKFFTDILEKDDIEALKMSLFLRKMSKQGKPVNGFKSDIRDKFGDRGANIANLCSSGYFEEFVEEFNTVTKDDFLKYYEKVVGHKARAWFIHSAITVDEMSVEFDAKIAKAKKYRMEDFRIHGRGKTNMQTIRKFVASRKEDEDYLFKKQFEDKKLSAIEYVVLFKR